MARIWTTEEINYLYDHVGKYKVETIAKNLNRPFNGVMLKMKRLGIGNTKEQVGITIGHLAELLNVDRKTVMLWARNHGLPHKRKVCRSSKPFYFVDTKDFWEWAFHHQDRIDFSKIEPHSIPPEPDFVEELRNKKTNTKGNCYRNWTTKEEVQLLELINEGNSIRSVSRLLNRTPTSIERKYQRLIHAENR